MLAHPLAPVEAARDALAQRAGLGLEPRPGALDLGPRLFYLFGNTDDFPAHRRASVRAERLRPISSRESSSRGADMRRTARQAPTPPGRRLRAATADRASGSGIQPARAAR